MRANRVAITGVGVVSCLGNSLPEVSKALMNGRVGAEAMPRWEELGLSSTVAAPVVGSGELRQGCGFAKEDTVCMTETALYCAVAAGDAIREAGLEAADLASRETACIVGSGVSGTMAIYTGGRKLFDGKARRVSPYAVLHSMASSCSAIVAKLFKIGGRSYSVTSACATSTHAIGHAYELIRDGRQQVVICGGGEELSEVTAGAFNAMRTALSTHFNDSPELASRPFDQRRDGFVLGEGAGILVLENLDHAKVRGAVIRAEIIGFAANSDGYSLVVPHPDGESAGECMKAAIADAELAPDEIDYVNAHATSTVLGDPAEGRALQLVFGNRPPPVSSTKGASGHAIGAAGALELIFCLAMLEGGFIAPNLNLEAPGEEFAGLDLPTRLREAPLSTVLSNSFGFGGTNSSLVIRRADS